MTYLKIAELGIGGSLLMWKEYFANSEIYEFEYNKNLMILKKILIMIE